MLSGRTQQDTAQATSRPGRWLHFPSMSRQSFRGLIGMAREVTQLSLPPGRAAGQFYQGALLWPADEPWSMCADPDHYKPLDASVGPEPVAMIPVVQLYAGDVPGLDFPVAPTCCRSCDARSFRRTTSTRPASGSVGAARR